jgi:tetratricopeptide (TPR) repeat protein
LLGNALSEQALMADGGARSSLRHAAKEAYKAVLDAYEEEWKSKKWVRSEQGTLVALQLKILTSEGRDRARYLGNVVKRLQEERDSRRGYGEELLYVRMNLALRSVELAMSATGPSQETMLGDAIHTCTLSDIYSSRDTSPQNWANLQTLCGTAHSERARYLDNARSASTHIAAIAAHREALEVFTRDTLPLDWARTQNNLGNALHRFAMVADAGERVALLNEAINAIREALEVRRRELRPTEWAASQRNLGEAHHALALLKRDEERTRHFDEAAAFYRAALQVFTQGEFHQAWADTQGDLALLLFDQASDTDGTEKIVLLQAALTAMQQHCEFYSEARDLDQFRRNQLWMESVEEDLRSLDGR